jgi:pimeloyl-ACP methyl ester carboxylesterase
MSVETLIDNIDHIIKKKNLKNIDFLGNSFGTTIINQLLDRNKDLIKKIVLVEPPILLGLNTKIIFDKNFNFSKDYLINKYINHKIKYKSASILEKLNSLVFRADYILLNMFKSFFHLYNIFPQKILLDMMKTNNVMIVLSRHDVLIDCKINDKIYQELGANVTISETYHGLAMMNTYSIIEITNFLKYAC